MRRQRCCVNTHCGQAGQQWPAIHRHTVRVYDAPQPRDIRRKYSRSIGPNAVANTDPNATLLKQDSDTAGVKPHDLTSPVTTARQNNDPITKTGSSAQSRDENGATFYLGNPPCIKLHLLLSDVMYGAFTKTLAHF
jgi:hypothetical protein